jgi:hypothetical protein
MRARVEVELLAMRARARQGDGIRTPRPKRLKVAREAGGGGRSTWNVCGDVWPKAGDIPRRHARGGRIAGQPGRTKTTVGPRIPA